MCWYFRTALETLSTQIGGEWSASRAKRDYWTFWESEFDSGSTSLLRMYLTTRDLTSWSQPYRDDKCTKQLYSVWILPVKYKRILNRHAHRIDPRVDKPASETHGPSCSDYRVAWDFDSSWITGPMTAHQSVAFVRHIKLAPAANLCTLSAIVFLPIKAWIWRHIRRYLDGSAIFLLTVCMTQMTKDFAMRHDESYVEWNGISIKWYQFVTNCPYHQTIYSKHNIWSFDFLWRFHDSQIVLPVDCEIKSGPRGCGKLTHNSFLH